MSSDKVLSTFVELGKQINALLVHGSINENRNAKTIAEFDEKLRKANFENTWFTRPNVINAFKGLVTMLDESTLSGFYASYTNDHKKGKSKKVIGLIMAGNIPMVGFHDLLCVLLCGQTAMVKLSGDDNVLMSYIIELLLCINPDLKMQVQKVERLSGMDAVIATGSNNSSRYFEYYFGKYPNIIRKNRNAVAVLKGSETDEELRLLGADIFTYFGLGCRNVSKLYVPYGYTFDRFFNNLSSFGNELMQHNKYMNNYDYHNALFLLEKIPFLTNNFLIIKQDTAIPAPVGVLNYECYSSADELPAKLQPVNNRVQCIISDKKSVIKGFENNHFYFGQSQQPSVYDFADGVDTMKFLLSLQ